MEATLSQTDNIPLIGELNLSLHANPRSPYVTNRAQVTSYCPQNLITHNGTNVMQFTIADSLAWCDPKSVAISYIIHNTGTGPLEFLSTNMESLFSRLQVTMGGTIVEDHTQDYNRLCTLFTKYQSTGNFGTILDAIRDAANYDSDWRCSTICSSTPVV